MSICWKSLIFVSLTLAVHMAGADDFVGAQAWQPFFAPVASRRDVQIQKNKFLGSGLEGEVFAIAKPDGHVISQKTYASEEDARNALKALNLLKDIERSGSLGPFKVIRILKKEGSVLEMEFIEGLSLNTLIREHGKDSRVRSLYASYLVGLKRVARRIVEELRPARPILDYDSYRKSCESSLSGLIVYDGSSPALRDRYARDDEYFYDEEILFGIDPSNVVVDRTTGELIIIDPF